MQVRYTIYVERIDPQNQALSFLEISQEEKS